MRYYRLLAGSSGVGRNHYAKILPALTGIGERGPAPDALKSSAATVRCPPVPCAPAQSRAGAVAFDPSPAVAALGPAPEAPHGIMLGVHAAAARAGRGR